MSYTSLSEMRNSKSSVEALLNAAKGPQKKNYDEDKLEVWSCQTDKMGNGSAVIRFLPAPKGEALPFAKMFNFGFKNPANNRWYIENSLTTIGENDPMVEFNNSLWATKDPIKIEQAKKQKRKTAYYSNVLIIKDPANPENEGKVKLFRYNKIIFDRLMLAANPNNEGLDPEDWIEAFDPFNPFTGANFNLKIKKVGEFANFDDCGFGKQKPLSDDDAVIEDIWNQCQPLAPIIGKDKFKTYEELQKKIAWVFGTVAQPATQSAAEVADDIGTQFEASTKPESHDTDDDSTDLDYFRNLANS